MSTMLGLVLLALTSSAGLCQASGFTEKGLSLLSYQLCSRQETRSVLRVEAVQTSHVIHTSCGGWIPWRRCAKTIYRTQYLAMDVPQSRNVTHCCEGYEQLGLYCVLPLEHLQEFASRPGVCPTAGPERPTSQCSLDTDCPGLQKCCPWSGGHRCLSPVPQGAAPERHRVSWYNVTVLVKMDFGDLQRMDPGLRNHIRLLYSLVTSALQPLDPAVHYLSSASQDASTTLSQLLLGLPRLLRVANVSSMLDDIVKRIYEVVHIRVQDVDECLHGELHACAGEQQCVNLEGSYQCQPGSSPGKPDRADAECPPLRDHVALNVTSSSFRVSWSLNSAQNHTFHVQVLQGELVLRRAWTSSLGLEVAGLEAGALYRVRTSYQGCGTNISAWLTVKTDAQVFEVTIRIVNRNLTEQLLNHSSVEHQEFSRQLLLEVEKSFPPAVSDLYRRGKLRVQIAALQVGSVVVRLRLTVQDPEFPVGVSTLTPLLQLLSASTVFQIDQQGTLVQDWDECANNLEHDCSPDARCINLEGSYTCQCRTTRDANPSRAGRACEGDVVGSTGSDLPVATGVTATTLSTRTTSLGPETSTLSLSPRHPWDTLAAGQAKTPGPPPRRGGSGTVGINRSSAAPGKQQEAPRVALGLGMGQGSTSVAASTSSLRRPEPTHGSPQGNTGSPLDTPAQFPGSPTVEPLFWPAPAEGPTGHIVWHTRLPTRGTPLDSSELQSEDPGLSPFSDLPSALFPTSLEPPACVPVPIERVTVSSVTSTSFHLAWVAGFTSHTNFRLTLVSPWSPAMSLETQDTKVTLTQLEPGILYRVEIVATVCGKEGTRAHLKVRTAAQTLSGKVRVANVRFSEALGNSSSSEHQHFQALFFRMVWDSLPAMLRQHMDSRGIRVDVTSITNGSIVVEFKVLIIVDMDVREVSAAFLSALQNATLLEVVRGDTTIWDYDECERQEDDCVPGTSCRNTLGSFTCICEGGALDFHVEYSGRPCEGSSGNLTQAPSTGQLPTSAGTRAALVPGARPTPQSPPPRLNLTSAVRVLCEIEKVAIAIQRRFLQQEAIPESSLYLGQPSCNVSDSNRTHVLLVAGWGECGTLVQSNVTSTVVRTMLRNDLSPEGIIHHLKILSPIHCAFRNDLLTSLGYAPEWGVYPILEDLHGAGNFVTEMQLFIGDSPIPQNYSVSASEDVKIEVGLYRQNSKLKVVLTECWATPSSNAGDPITFGFINNSCPIPNTYTSVIENGNSSKAQFKLRIFSFINNSVVYLHCRLRVCMESPRATCKINCDEFRLLRSNEGSTHQMSWGPLIRSEGTKPGLGASYVVLIVVTIFAVVTGAAALLIMRYQKVTGKYNFSTQSDDFSYQVFSE